MPLVWYRMILAAITLLVYLQFKGIKLALPNKEVMKLVGIGGVVAFHWVFFYHSIKISTVSVALVSLSSLTLFTSFLEPLFNRTRIFKLDVLIGFIIIIGIALIFHFETRYAAGIVFGLLSAILAAVFTILNAQYVKKYDPVTISFYEMLGGFSVLTLYLLITNDFNVNDYYLSLMDWIYLIILATICTAFAYVMGVAVMKTLSAYTVVLITNLEPIYGIILAFIFFGAKEKMTTEFYLGSFVILGAVFLYPVLKKQVNKNRKLNNHI